MKETYKKRFIVWLLFCYFVNVCIMTKLDGIRPNSLIHRHPKIIGSQIRSLAKNGTTVANFFFFFDARVLILALPLFFCRHGSELPTLQIAFQYTVVVPPAELSNSELGSATRYY